MPSPSKPSVRLAPGALHREDPGPDWSELIRELDQLSRPDRLASDPAHPQSPPEVLVALSGGADSVYLLDCLRSLEVECQLIAVHVNHQLRGAASDADMDFCEDLCAAWGIPLQTSTVQLNPISGDLERRAREARYAAIGTLAAQKEIGIVITAHHLDDAIETLLMRWTRGMNSAGLVGMQGNSPFPVPVDRGPSPRAGSPIRVLRPLLGMTAGAIRSRLVEREIRWREDASNASSQFTRNRVRHQLLPLLRATCGPDVERDLAQFQSTLETHEERLAQMAPGLAWEARPGTSRESWRLARSDLREFPVELMRRSLYSSLLALTGVPPRDRVLKELIEALEAGEQGNWNLRGAWGLGLEVRFLRLKAPPR